MFVSFSFALKRRTVRHPSKRIRYLTALFFTRMCVCVRVQSLAGDDDNLSDVEELYNFPMPSETDIKILYRQPSTKQRQRGSQVNHSNDGSSRASLAFSDATTTSKRGSNIVDIHITDLAEHSDSDESIESLSDADLTLTGIDVRLLRRYGAVCFVRFF